AHRWGLGEGQLTRQTCARDIGAQGAGQLDDVRCRRRVAQIELGDAGDVIEHRRQLARHGLDLVLAQREAREARDVQNLIAVDHRVDSTRRAERGRTPQGRGRGGGETGSYVERRSSLSDCHAPASTASAPTSASQGPAHSCVECSGRSSSLTIADTKPIRPRTTVHTPTATGSATLRSVTVLTNSHSPAPAASNSSTTAGPKVSHASSRPVAP